MFCCACSCQRYSFPIRRAGSPLHVSSVARIAKDVPAACRIFASAFATRWFRRSNDAAQPTKYRYSASGFSANVGTPRPDAQSPRVLAASPHGLPARSMFVIARWASGGAAASCIVR